MSIHSIKTKFVSANYKTFQCNCRYKLTKNEWNKKSRRLASTNSLGALTSVWASITGHTCNWSLQWNRFDQPVRHFSCSFLVLPWWHFLLWKYFCLFLYSFMSLMMMKKKVFLKCLLLFLDLKPVAMLTTRRKCSVLGMYHTAFEPYKMM